MVKFISSHKKIFLMAFFAVVMCSLTFASSASDDCRFLLIRLGKGNRLHHAYRRMPGASFRRRTESADFQEIPAVHNRDSALHVRRKDNHACVRRLLGNHILRGFDENKLKKCFLA